MCRVNIFINSSLSSFFNQFSCSFCCSGLWGVLCVGIFSKECLIREIYENLCFCVNSKLPEAVII